uniref:Cytochrome c oxidase assembly protein COX20, mitochondrial n=1 Tax=Clastoptera arizonana TaxID=38151 RepID=A0A1B6E2A4_9HEMI
MSERSFYIFGRDVSDIPCFRNSFLYGILGGFTGGLLHFLFTSKVKKSTHVGFGTFWVGTWCYWFYCRHHYNKSEAELIKVRDYLQNKMLEEGTRKEKKSHGSKNLEIVEIKNDKTEV